MPCPRCKTEATRTLPATHPEAAGSLRVECAKCSRFVRWEILTSKKVEISHAEPVPTPAASPDPILEEVGTPEAWLYVSKRLDLEWLPNVPPPRDIPTARPLWGAPAISLGGRVYYRLSAAVLVWLDAAGEQLEAGMNAGTVPRSQVDEYLKVMTEVWAFAACHLSDDAIRTARKRPPELPEGPRML